jgi:glycosyltransferase involved in cell wall biosynthesis
MMPQKPVGGGKEGPLRVLHISTYDTMGGAARSARRVHEGLCRLGVDSWMLVWRKSSQDERIDQFAPPRRLDLRLRQRLGRPVRARQAARYADRRRDPFQPFSDDRTDYLVSLDGLKPRPDVVNLFWIAGFPDYTYFFRHLPERMAIVWRLSDMNPFTGGCHYAWDCEKWTDSCGACPVLGSNDERDLSRDIWQRKQKAYRGRTIQIVAPSHWIAREAARSSLLQDQPVTVIPNGLDTSVFRPRDPREARDILRLPQNCTIILAGADHLNDGRKGFRYLLKALRDPPLEQGTMLVTVGGGEPEEEIGPALTYQALGRIEEDGLLAAAYSAADLFVVPSLHENLPNAALEAMACGTPVIGFRTGGIVDIVQPGHTGLLASRKNVADLARQIWWLLDHPEERRRMGAGARSLVEQEHSLDLQARRFAEVYRSARRPTAETVHQPDGNYGQ